MATSQIALRRRIFRPLSAVAAVWRGIRMAAAAKTEWDD